MKKIKTFYGVVISVMVLAFVSAVFYLLSFFRSFSNFTISRSPVVPFNPYVFGFLILIFFASVYIAWIYTFYKLSSV